MNYALMYTQRFSVRGNMAGCLFTGLLTFLVCLNLSEASEFAGYFKDTVNAARGYAVNQTFFFASYYDDHMVLQMAPAKSGIWGYAPMSAIGKPVTVYIKGSSIKRKMSTTVRKGPFVLSAVWSVQLDPVHAGGPYQITGVLAGHAPITLSDVLFGDVWLCSGQSNMQFAMNQMFGKSYEYSVASDYKDIRLFNVQRVTFVKPLFDLRKIISSWTAPSSAVFDGGWNGFSAVCYMYGKYLYDNLKYPIGLIDSTWGGTPVEGWSSPEALAKCNLDKTADSSDFEKPVDDLVGSFERRDNFQMKFDQSDVKYSPQANSVLWNAMIHPFLKMSIKGVIWYQGEQNEAYHRDLYTCTFPAMVTDWRNKFYQSSQGQVSRDMPFGFVQIGPILEPTTPFGYPIIRWHQMGDNVQKLPLSNMFMAVAMDLADNESSFASVHPRDKKTVAERLARAALNNVYGSKSIHLNYLYPTKEIILPKAKELAVQFGDTFQINIHIKEGFEICCSSNYSKCPIDSTVNWVPSPIVKSNINTIWLSWKQCQSTTIAAYRYAWRPTPCNYRQCAVYNDFTGDPLPTFTKRLGN